MSLSMSSLHHAIVETIVARSNPPSVRELRKRFDASQQEIETALTTLAEYHGVVLHPGTHDVWVIHPFSLAPTGFLVTASTGRWWGTCAWCSLGIVELVGGTATVATQLGWSGRHVHLRFEDSKLLDPDYVIHFPIPMTSAWDNVIYTCSMMLLFADDNAVHNWAEHHQKPIGDIRGVEQIWEFSREWYGTHLSPDWEKWTLTEAAEIFSRHGLDGPIWQLPVGDGRF